MIGLGDCGALFVGGVFVLFDEGRSTFQIPINEQNDCQTNQQERKKTGHEFHYSSPRTIELDRFAIAYTDEPSRLAYDSGTIWQIVITNISARFAHLFFVAPRRRSASLGTQKM